MGFFLGVGGVLTFKNARKLVEVVEYAPMDRLVLETDCPFLAPEPHRRERNDSRFLPLVVKKLAEIKGISEEEVIRVTEENAKRLYRME
jgi:TatD DNase family protein